MNPGPASARHFRLSVLTIMLLAGCTGCANIPTFKHQPAGQPAAAASPEFGARAAQFNIGELSAAEKPVPVEEQQRSVLFAKARLLETDGQLARAAMFYEDILKSDPNHAAALHRLSVVHAEQGEIDAADDGFRRALRIDADNAQLHCDYGYFCYLRRRWNEAEQHLSRAVELDPSLSAAHNNLGLLAACRGEADFAVECCRRAGCTTEEAQQNVSLVQALESQPDSHRGPVSTGKSGEPAGVARIGN